MLSVRGYGLRVFSLDRHEDTTPEMDQALQLLKARDEALTAEAAKLRLEIATLTAERDDLKRKWSRTAAEKAYVEVTASRLRCELRGSNLRVKRYKAMVSQAIATLAPPADGSDAHLAAIKANYEVTTDPNDLVPSATVATVIAAAGYRLTKDDITEALDAHVKSITGPHRHRLKPAYANTRLGGVRTRCYRYLKERVVDNQ